MLAAICLRDALPDTLAQFYSANPAPAAFCYQPLVILTPTPSYNSDPAFHLLSLGNAVLLSSYPNVTKHLWSRRYCFIWMLLRQVMGTPVQCKCVTTLLQRTQCYDLLQTILT